MRRALLPLILALAAGPAFTQTQGQPMGAPLTGVVKTIGPSEIVLTTADGDVSVDLTAQTHVLQREGGSVDDIKAGAYLGTANQSAADGVSNLANEVHVMTGGPNVEQQMDPQNNPGLMMTNGHVAAVKATDQGTEMDVDYGGSQTRHVVVPKDTSVTRLTEVGVSALKPGMNVAARLQPDAAGRRVASYIVIGKLP